MLETDHAGGKNDARGVLLKHFERKKYSKLQSDFYRVHRYPSWCRADGEES